MRNLILFLCLFVHIILLTAQEGPSLKNYSFTSSNLKEGNFKDLVIPKIEKSQFVFLGEHHGIVEVGKITNLLYQWANPYGYKTLCIETDDVAAQKILGFLNADDPIESAKIFENANPFSIPFYNNTEDYKMFMDVFSNGGTLWGIDQTFIGQFRLNFEHLISITKNKAFKKALIPLRDAAQNAFKTALETKNPMAPYIFQYNEEIHAQLMALAETKQEKEILGQLMKTKEIYGYFFEGKHYWNNEIRGRLMKSNFLRYYREAEKKSGTPKVVFKLGYNHAARGLTMTNIYDISNMCSELALTNGMESLHILAMGVSGKEFKANPFDPTSSVKPVDNSRYLPSEFIELASSTSDKYVIIKTQELRPFSKDFSAAVKKFIFKFDVIILINDTTPLTGF